VSQHRGGCCCGDCSVGIFCPTDVLYKNTAAPGFSGRSIEQIYKSIYDDRGKGKVCRIDSEATLSQVNVAYFGILTPVNVVASPPTRYVFRPNVVTSSPTTNGVIHGYASPWWTSSSLGEALSKFVARGGRLVLIGDGYGNSAVGGPPVFSEAAVDHCNQVMIAANNGNSLVSQFVNTNQCINCFGECFCTAGTCVKYSSVKQIDPGTPFSFYQDNGIYNASGCFVALFAPGNTNETFPLTPPIPHGSTNTCGSPLAQQVYPIAYTQLSGGHHMVVADVNCFMTSPTIINIFNQGGGGCACGTNCNGGCCPTASTVPATLNSACNPTGIFTGLNYFDINLPFLWSLSGKCPTCP